MAEAAQAPSLLIGSWHGGEFLSFPWVRGGMREIFDSSKETYAQELLAASLDPDPEAQRQKRKAHIRVSDPGCPNPR